MAKEHGIKVTEKTTRVKTPIEASGGVQVIFGTAPINMSSDISNVINRPVLANSYAEAVEKLGYSENYKKYTLCQSMSASFKIFNVSPVVFVNVLDPRKHKKEMDKVTAPIIDKQVIVKTEGIIPSGLAVTGESGTPELTEGVDYTIGFSDEGYLVLDIIDEGQAAGLENLEISGNVLDPDAVTSKDIVGGYDSATATETGIECVRRVYPRLQLLPGFLMAPGWSHDPEVAAALQAKCTDINGEFKAMCLIDIDTDKARKYSDTKEIKETSAIVSEYAIPLWPCLKLGDKIYDYSAIYGAAAQYEDSLHDNVPSRSPSNISIKVGGACLKDGTEVDMDLNQANTVNGYGIVTAININGWKAWGNNTAAYPSSNETKDIWISVRRMFNWQGNNFILTYITSVDDKTNYRLIEDIVNSENIRLSAYCPEHMAGAAIEFDSAENPLTALLTGKIKFHQYIAPYLPAETIENELEFDTDMLATALSGGGTSE